MARKVQRKVEGWKSKEWFSIEAPEYLNRSVIGSTMTGDSSNLVGRMVETTVGELTNDMTKNNTKVLFRITNITGDVASTALVGHELTTDYIRSIVKRQTSRIDAIVNRIPQTADRLIVGALMGTSPQGQMRYNRATSRESLSRKGAKASS